MTRLTSATIALVTAAILAMVADLRRADAAEIFWAIVFAVAVIIWAICMSDEET
jgi:hypothetical protein